MLTVGRVSILGEPQTPIKIRLTILLLLNELSGFKGLDLVKTKYELYINLM